MMKQTLTEGKVSTQLIKLTIPLIWGVFSVIAFSVIDTYYVGRLGTESLAAMSFTFPVVMTFGSLAMGLGVGASSVIARAIGEGDSRSIRRFATDSLTLSLLVVIVFAFLGLLTINPLFTLLGAKKELLPLIHSYMELWYWGMICLVVPMVGNNIIRASGNTLLPSIIMIVAALVNIILDPIFIFGWLGFPRLEIAGAAMATVISRFVTLVASLWFLHFRLKMLSWEKESLGVIVKSWLSILKISIPVAASNVINPISFGILTGLVSVYGSEAVAAFGIASRIEAFSFIIVMALSATMGPFAGQNWGAKQYHRVRQALKQSFGFCLFWGVFSAIVLAVMGGEISSWFDSDTEVIKIASIYFQVVPISYGAYGIVLIANSTFNALGKPLPSTIITVLRMLALNIPLAYLGGRFLGIIGIFGAGCLANLLIGIGAYYWTKKTCHQAKLHPEAIPVKEDKPLANVK